MLTQFTLQTLPLIISAGVGVYGSYKLYQKKEKDQEESLRTALISELKGTEMLNRWPDLGIVPAYDFVPRSVYENNSGDLAYLNERETQEVVKYYSRAKTTEAVLDIHSDLLVEYETSQKSDFNQSDREDGRRKGIDKLELYRQRTISALSESQNLKSTYQEGTSLAELPDRISSDEAILRDFGLAEKDGSSSASLTEKGERFFADGASLTGEDREQDVLNRNPTTRSEKIGRILGDYIYKIKQSLALIGRNKKE